jgi:hypothetical protein
MLHPILDIGNRFRNMRDIDPRFFVLKTKRTLSEENVSAMAKPNSIVPPRRDRFLITIPAIDRRLTFKLSLRDTPHRQRFKPLNSECPNSGHFVPGYYHAVPLRQIHPPRRGFD